MPSYEGGETVSAVARRHGLTAQQLFRLAAGGAATSRGGENGSAFTPVIVEAAPPPCAESPRLTGRLARLPDDRDHDRGMHGSVCAWDRSRGFGSGATRRASDNVIAAPAGVRVLVATKPVDFRRGADSLAALVREQLRHDPFSGTIFIFRSKRADRLKILAWDGSGLVLLWKRLEQGAFAGRRSATA